MVGLGKIFGRSVKNFGRPGQFLKVWKKIRNVREKISEKMYGKKSRGSKILATRGRGDFVKFYLALPQNACCPSNTPPPKFRDLAPPLVESTIYASIFLKLHSSYLQHLGKKNQIIWPQEIQYFQIHYAATG